MTKGSEGLDALFEIEKKADRSIWVDSERNFDLGLGEVIGGGRAPIQFGFPKIRAFLENERHKDMVVVWFDKSVMWQGSDFVSTRATEVLTLMKEVGYKRVVILGAAGSGAHYVADSSLKNETAGNVKAEEKTAPSKAE